MAIAVSDILIGLFGTTLSLSPLFIFAGLGEIVAEKSGVANMGLEGIMLMSAFTTFAVDVMTRSIWLGIAAALAVAAVFGIIFGGLAVRLRLEQITLGLGIYLFGQGLSFVLYSAFSGGRALPLFSNLQRVTIPFLSSIPVLGPVLFHQNILVYIALFLVPLFAKFLDRTSLGLRVKAVAEDHKASDNMGISVLKVRFLAVMVGALMAGLAGAYFEVGFLQSFQFDIIMGRGFVALAIIYFANWSPYKTLFGALGFTFVSTGQSLFIQLAGPAFQQSSFFFNVLPYIFIVALIPIFGRNARPPKYLLNPYKKG